MLRRTRMLVVGVMAGVVVMGCSPAGSTNKPAAPEAGLTACEDPRPYICTAHYEPVCGFTGGDNYTTYSNACSACSDKAVSGHRPGACE